MGDTKDDPEEWMNASRPIHRVELEGFYMDTCEVTVGQFKKFVNETGYNYSQWNDLEQYSFSPTDAHPMICVNWYDATAYAEWAGKRLPTEAEWEYAARGGLEGKRYSWGNQATHENANFLGVDANSIDQWKYCSPVGKFQGNGYGLFDISGNVYEWCSDWYSVDYYSKAPRKNPLGPETGRYKVLRGGAWNRSKDKLRVASRHYSKPQSSQFFNTGGFSYGFRCVSLDSFPSTDEFTLKTVHTPAIEDDPLIIDEPGTPAVDDDQPVTSEPETPAVDDDQPVTSEPGTPAVDDDPPII
ncbi:hypothetical protein CMK18_15735, partial [Candidatus Poribacteria bacterium]|nr:hypothetical protein [Candidatus Poribacteria bacterium]